MMINLHLQSQFKMEQNNDIGRCQNEKEWGIHPQDRYGPIVIKKRQGEKEDFQFYLLVVKDLKTKEFLINVESKTVVKIKNQLITIEKIYFQMSQKISQFIIKNVLNTSQNRKEKLVLEYFQKNQNEIRYDRSTNILYFSFIEATGTKPFAKQNFPIQQKLIRAFIALKILYFIIQQYQKQENNHQITKNQSSFNDKFEQNGSLYSMRNKLINYISQIQVKPSIYSENQIEFFKKVVSIKEQFRLLFDFKGNRHLKYRQSVFKQENFLKAAVNHQLVFNPTSSTKQILKILMFHCSNFKGKNKEEDINLMNNKIKFIHGRAGIGKSLSTCLAYQLFQACHQAIHLFNLQSIPQQNLQPAINKLEIQQLRQIPKIFYYTFSKTSTPQQFYNTLRKQLPYQLRVMFLKDEDILNNINDYYNGLSLKYVYFVDQINIFYSMVRDANNTLPEQLTNLNTILIKLSQFSLILSSSQNIQSYLDLREYRFKDIVEKANNIKIRHDQLKINCRRIQEKLFMIYFEIQKQLKKKIAQHTDILQIQQYEMMMAKKQSQFQYLLSLKNFQQICQNSLNFLSEITHQFVQAYFTNDFGCLKQNIFSQILQDKGPQNLSEKEVQAAQDFIYFLSSIHEYGLKIENQRYLAFLRNDKHGILTSKVNVVSSLRQIALKKIQNGQDGPIIYPINNKDKSNKLIQGINKQNSIISKDSVTIYYSPKSFLEITQFMHTDFSFISGSLCQIFKKMTDSGSLFGDSFNYTLVYLLSRHSSTLHADNQYFTISTARQKHEQYTPFIHFYQIKSNPYSNCISFNFKKLFHSIKKIRSDEYVAAVPTTNQQNRIHRDPKFSSNSQIIDCLLLSKTKIEDQYDLITFDFCTSLEHNSASTKMKDAKQFFDFFIQTMKEENSKKGIQILKNKCLSYVQQLKKIKQRQIRKKLDSQKIQHQIIVYSQPVKKYSFSRIVHYIIVPQIAVNGYRKNNQATIYQGQNKLIIKIISLEQFFVKFTNETTKQFNSIDQQAINLQTILRQELKRMSDNYI